MPQFGIISHFYFSHSSKYLVASFWSFFITNNIKYFSKWNFLSISLFLMNYMVIFLLLCFVWDSVFIYSPDWPRSCNPSASAFCVLGLEVWFILCWSFCHHSFELSYFWGTNYIYNVTNDMCIYIYICIHIRYEALVIYLLQSFSSSVYLYFNLSMVVLKSRCITSVKLISKF